MLQRCWPLAPSQERSINNTQSEVSGVVKITGIPKAMSGSADLRFGPGKIAGEPLESLIARERSMVQT